MQPESPVPADVNDDLETPRLSKPVSELVESLNKTLELVTGPDMKHKLGYPDHPGRQMIVDAMLEDNEDLIKRMKRELAHASRRENFEKHDDAKHWLPYLDTFLSKQELQ